MSMNLKYLLTLAFYSMDFCSNPDTKLLVRRFQELRDERKGKGDVDEQVFAS